VRDVLLHVRACVYCMCMCVCMSRGHCGEGCSAGNRHTVATATLEHPDRGCRNSHDWWAANAPKPLLRAQCFRLHSPEHRRGTDPPAAVERGRVALGQQHGAHLGVGGADGHLHEAAQGGAARQQVMRDDVDLL
jgi:hypothetical protein